MNEENKLKFQYGNAKLDKSILTFSLPAGYTCPGARECLSRADVDKGIIVDGPDNKFRCFAASQEAVYSVVREARWHNFSHLQTAKLRGGWQEMYRLIMDSLPEKYEKVRIHVSGDFFCMEYFQAWVAVAKALPDKIFYAYTKSLPYWAANKHLIPDNFRLTASRGGKFDHLIAPEGFRDVEVIFHPDEAAGRPIDHDDSHAYGTDQKSFALLLHGTQPKGSDAAKAMQTMKAEGVNNGYPSKK